MDETKIIDLEDGTELHIVPTDEGVAFDRIEGGEVIETGYMLIEDILELIH